MNNDSVKFENFLNVSNIKFTYSIDKDKYVYIFNEYLDKYIFILDNKNPNEIKLIIQIKYENNSFEIEKIITFIRKIFDKIQIEEIYDIEEDKNINTQIKLMLNYINKHN